MLKGISSLVVIVIVLIAAGIGTGGYFLVQQSPTTTTTPIQTTTIQETTTTESTTTQIITTTSPTTTTIQEINVDFDLSIDIPKTSVSTDEDFSGKYNVERKGDPYEIYIVTLCRKEDDEDGCYSRGKGSLEKYDFGAQLKPCGGTTCVEDSFKNPGTYIFELMIYDCSEIESVMGVACSIDVDHKEVAVQISPIESTQKTVTVTGEVINGGEETRVCQNNDDCTQTCEGCKYGTYICASISGEYKCVGCITTLGCKSGYNCEDNDCVKAEKTCAEEGGIDCSVEKGCAGGIMFRATDTDYCCLGYCV